MTVSRQQASGTGHDGRVADAPAFRIWPPLALGVPLLFGGIMTGTVIFVPLGTALLFWGAIVPEEHYLSAKFGEEYDAYCTRVRRWI
jgi:protein-S-isoprenylcysteine O-methyltransferase Ste14